MGAKIGDVTTAMARTRMRGGNTRRRQNVGAETTSSLCAAATQWVLTRPRSSFFCDKSSTIPHLPSAGTEKERGKERGYNGSTIGFQPSPHFGYE